ncbi:hypothetical protein BKA63DRAFT_579088 [Paraphoma chrysanthemicola]|nr:hypothetical protein BKA63DRAFT_579088 [Paraphoma chrysanthemicola]
MLRRSVYRWAWMAFVLLCHSFNFTPSRTTLNLPSAPTNVQDLLNGDSEHYAPPKCALKISDLCPALLRSAQSCQFFRPKQECYCPLLANTPCPGLCKAKQEPISYLNWAKDYCGGVADTFSNKWVDYEAIQSMAFDTLFPWSWHVRMEADAPQDRTHDTRNRKCPSRFEKLGIFALLNIVTLVGTVLLCRRTIIEKLTRGYLGKPGSKLWIVSGLASAGLSVGANFINAILVQKADGYHDVPVVQLALLWCSRPRIAWIAGALILFECEQSMYFAVGASSVLSELILQAIGCYYLFRTAIFASDQGYYYQGLLYAVQPGGRDAVIMYVGALLWQLSIISIIVMICVTLVMTRRWSNPSRTVHHQERGSNHQLWAATIDQSHQSRSIRFEKLGIWLRDIGIRNRLASGTRSPDPNAWKVILRRMGISPRYAKRMVIVVVGMVFPFLGQWLFWAGFVRLSGDL